jgi:hypothetical protein
VRGEIKVEIKPENWQNFNGSCDSWSF